MIGPKFWAEDAIAVMDAVGCEQATIFAPSFTSMTGLVLAADYPERVRNLVIVNGAARTLWAPDYPIGARMDTQRTVHDCRDRAGRGRAGLRRAAGSSRPASPATTRSARGGIRPATGRHPRAWPVLSPRLSHDRDVRDRLSRITAPTLILHRDRSPFIPVEHGRYLAEHIAGSRYVELPGADVLYWVGDTAPMLDEIEEFITGVRGGSDAERVLTTIVFTDIVGSTQRAAELGDDRWRDLLDNHDSIVRHELRALPRP